jgi:peroxiredoxin Q/BCP
MIHWTGKIFRTYGLLRIKREDRLMAKLNEGDTAADFGLMDQFGKMVHLKDFKGRKLLLYFFPKAGTSGWTKQTEAVRDALAQLKALGVAAVGISPDALAAQKKFSDKLQLNFPLLSDSDHAVADAYGAWGEKSLYGKKYFGITRSSFLINEKGKISAAWYKISPNDTVSKALAALGAD